MAGPTTQEKALQINVDATRYGTFAEIGAGQEVARWFFHVDGEAGWESAVPERVAAIIKERRLFEVHVT
jgi:hypothetical protein